MSFQLKFSIALHVKSFKNINLYNQGNYYAEIRFYVQTKKDKFYAKPIAMEKVKNSNPRRNTVSKWMSRNNIDSQSLSGIDLTTFSYKTHGFNIKYIEEE